MSFGLAGIRGHPMAVRLLQRLLVRGRLPSALLIEGPSGIGRRSLGRALAAARLCHQPVAGDACGDCPSCRAMAGEVHADFVELPNQALAPLIAVDEVRQRVVEAASETPLMGAARAFLLPDLERYQRGGVNALLKVLEEPPAGVHLILTASSGEALLATIRSRCMRLRLHALSSNDLTALLVGQGLDPATARARAEAADGTLTGTMAVDGGSVDRDLQRLAGTYEPGLIADLLSRLATAAKEVAGQTAAARERAVLDAWLRATCQAVRTGLRSDDPEPAMARAALFNLARRRLAVNLQPRLVLEGIGLGA